MMLMFCCLFITLLLLGLASPSNSSSTTSSNTEDKSEWNGDRKVPNYWGCQNEVAKTFKYCDASLPIEERLEALLSELTLEEKVEALSPNPNKSTCATHTNGVSRLGLPNYMWLVETNTAVASECLAPDKCTTEFAGPMSMAASFNRTSWYLKGRVFGTEQRALVNIHATRGNTNERVNKIGITAYGPNINQQRDARFGRSSELPGEDPYLAGEYAAEMVRGMQDPDEKGRPKVLAYLKHFTAYNRETQRGSDTYNITLHDLFDTYLPQYEVAMTKGAATGVMCSYNGINGRPLCANDYFLNQILRKKWNRPDAHVTTDCGAVAFLRGPPVYAPDGESASAWALNNGTDIEMGSTFWTRYLVGAIQRNLTSEAHLDVAFRRSYLPHFRAGRFDDPADSEWGALGIDHIASETHRSIRLDAALQGLVLLKNQNKFLPLDPNDARVVVLGPLAQTRAGLMSDYEDDQSCFGGGHGCLPTIFESIRTISKSATNATGVDVDSDRTDGILEALVLAEEADVVILCLGITKTQEHEGIDRSTTSLPGLQESFAVRVMEVGKPVVLVLVNGGQVTIDNLVDGSSAIVEAFSPNGIGETALAMSLFGLANRWGKLPYTMYPESATFDMEDHSMSKPPGRTHRYYTGKAIFPFGFGLSYTRFDMRTELIGGDDGGIHQISFQVNVTNVGSRAGDEVLQVYHVAGDDIRSQANHPVPLQSLVDFVRVSVTPGETVSADISIDKTVAFQLVNEFGERVLHSGTNYLVITNGADYQVRYAFDSSFTKNELPISQ